LLACLLVLLPLSAAASPRLKGIEAAGKARLDAGEIDPARELFLAGRKEAERAGETRWQARFSFYLGRTHQTAAGKPGGETFAHLQQAAGHYSEVLKLQPDSAATARNLAQVYFEMAAVVRRWEDDPDSQSIGIHPGLTAAGYLERSRKLADVEQQVELAQRLESEDQWRAAAELWKAVVQEKPRSAEPHRKMMELYLERQANDLLPYLWQILDAGQAVRAVDGALEALDAGGWEKPAKVDLLAVVAAGLARQVSEPREFPDSSVGQRLQKLESDPDVGRGCRELRGVHAVDKPTPEMFPWWQAQRSDDYQEPPYGRWPRDAFRELVRSLASWHRSRKDFAAAEGFYSLSVDLDPRQVDLEAFSGLVRLTIEEAGPGDEAGIQRRLAALDAKYRDRLFRGKFDAYRRSAKEEVFAYHRTLGELYSALGRWGDESTATTAIFQLSRARDVAARIEQKAADDGETVETSRFTPEMANLLAVAYEQVGKTDKGLDVRLQAISDYRKLGDDKAAEKVIRPNYKTLPPSVLRNEKLLVKPDAQTPELDEKKIRQLEKAKSQYQQDGG
jgi:tetratricopeptide (TPR) repeat protein